MAERVDLDQDNSQKKTYTYTEYVETFVPDGTREKAEKGLPNNYEVPREIIVIRSGPIEDLP